MSPTHLSCPGPCCERRTGRATRVRSEFVRLSRRGAEAWRACSRWEPHSYGYHGDDGKKFHNHGQGHDYGPTYSTGDVIGAGVHLERQEIFFTRAPSPAGPCWPAGCGS